jgi:hypothetical protein
VLTEPDVNVSAHPAPAIEPPTDAALASEQTGYYRVLPSVQTSATPVGDAASVVNGFALPKMIPPNIWLIIG